MFELWGMHFARPQRIRPGIRLNLGIGHAPLVVKSVAQTMQSDRELVEMKCEVRRRLCRLTRQSCRRHDHFVEIRRCGKSSQELCNRTKQSNCGRTRLRAGRGLLELTDFVR